MTAPASQSDLPPRITVMGLGRFGGGVGVTRWLARQGVRVTVTDQAGADALGESVAALTGLDVILHLGGHDAQDFTDCDMLVVNPAVPFDAALIDVAHRTGAAVTTEINLFLQRCPAPVVGVTGSAGKSTTTSMTGRILARGRTVHVGGNIGVSLLETLDEIAPDHAVVLELSSFQLHYLPLIGLGPRVAVVTNLQPNHLDRHGSMARYAHAKRHLLQFQTPDDTAVLNRDDPAVAAWADETPARVVWFSADDESFDLAIPGPHNQANAQAAFQAARALGATRTDATAALKNFTALPHRLQLVAQRDGVRFYNDSKATTPREAVAALLSFPPRSAVVIVGGSDKQTPFDELCAALAARAKAVVATGQTGSRIADGIQAAGGAVPTVVREPDFARAVAAATRLAEPGDVVLLSPGCASYDQFTHFQHRGETFTKLVVPS